MIESVVAGNLIAGRWAAGEGEAAASVNPADPSEVVVRHSLATLDDVTTAVSAAKEAGPSWAATSPLARAAVLRRAAQEVGARAGELARMLTREEGKPLGEARGEVDRAELVLHFHAAQAWQATGETFASGNPAEEVRTLRTPVGVVGVITPFNFPIAIPAWKLAPALVHGNTVVWKPAAETPAIAIELARILVAAGLPPGTLNLLLGDAEIGADLVRHPDVEAITFTGSEVVGARIRVEGARRGARVQLEMGGHNPAVVLADADLDNAAAHIVAGAMGSTGQKCTATRRAIVDASIHDALVDRLQRRLESLRIGNGLEPGIDVGPLVSAEARVGVLRAIADAEEQGAAVQTLRSDGAWPHGDGYYVRPTLVTGVDAAMTIAQEEVFGPVLAVISVDGDDEALAVANATRFGLAASVFTSSDTRARRAMLELRAGVIHVNNATTGSEPHVPFGGISAASAQGPPEQGQTARDFFTQIKTAYLDASLRRDR
jgi:aldehyde dehydrogenase (NAD+)